MAKVIKRVGIVFFVLVISFLLILGCVFTVNVVEHDNFASLNSENVEQTGVADEEFVPDFILSGTNAQIESQWNTIMQAASTDATRKERKIRLDSDWIATTTDASHAFGTGVGFYTGGAIAILAHTKIVFDLNGHTIDRKFDGKSQAQTLGCCFVVAGELTLLDSAYDAQVFEDIYINAKGDKNVLQRKIDNIRGNYGRISGGCNTTSGGGIYVGARAILTMHGGIISNNYAGYGGGVTLDTNASFNMYGGIIYNNTNLVDGGGICISNATFNMYDGLVLNNIAQSYGGGISVSDSLAEVTSKFNMYDGIVAYNTSLYGGGIAFRGKSVGVIKNADISYNYSSGNSAGVVVWDDNTKADFYDCRITNNLSYHTSGINGGAGVLTNSVINIYNSEITDNTFINGITSEIGCGGGVYVNANGKAKLDGVIIARNNAYSDINDGLHSAAGGIGFATTAQLQLGSNVQIYDNTAHGIKSDLRLEVGQTINVSNMGTNSYIGIKTAEEFGITEFTVGYGANNGNPPTQYFFNNDCDKMAVLNNQEVYFEKILASDDYDFIFYENGLRKNYKDNNLIHAVNDYAKSKTVNGGKLILGNIKPNTSVNSFISKINLSANRIKLFDSHGNLIYDKGNNVSGIDTAAYADDKMYSVGTGWLLETYGENNVKIENITLSVLGDVNGDGRISASDVSYLRQIANDSALFESLSVEKKLASIVLNKSSVTTADAEIIRNVLGKLLEIELFF